MVRAESVAAPGPARATAASLTIAEGTGGRTGSGTATTLFWAKTQKVVPAPPPSPSPSDSPRSAAVPWNLVSPKEFSQLENSSLDYQKSQRSPTRKYQLQ